MAAFHYGLDGKDDLLDVMWHNFEIFSGLRPKLNDVGQELDTVFELLTVLMASFLQTLAPMCHNCANRMDHPP